MHLNHNSLVKQIVLELQTGLKSKKVKRCKKNTNKEHNHRVRLFVSTSLTITSLQYLSLI
jgi:hypothetical protein